MDAVFEKTRELGKALLESEAYARVKAAEARIAQNPAAVRVMNAYQEKRNELHCVMQSEDPDPMEMKRLSDELDELRECLEMMEEVIALNEAQNGFSELIAKINQLLQFIVTGEMPGQEACSGSCSGCPGCH